jgi:hypothetical protein
MSKALAVANADAIEAQADAAAVWSLRLDECTADQRATLIDFHGSVAALLRERGHRIRGGIVYQDGREYITLRLRSGHSWRVPDGH